MTGRLREVITVDSIEGLMQGKAGNWLIIEIDGEVYPCDAGIFSRA